MIEHNTIIVSTKRLMAYSANSVNGYYSIPDVQTYPTYTLFIAAEVGLGNVATLVSRLLCAIGRTGWLSYLASVW